MITLDYKLYENDLLNVQLYFASKDERIQQQRKKEKVRMLGLSVLCGVMLFFEEQYRTYSFFFLGATLIFFVVYPWWSAWFYKRMYKKQIAAFFGERQTIDVRLILNDNNIVAEGERGKRFLETKNIDSIIEIGAYFFISPISGSPVVIPKKEITDILEIKELLNSYTEIISVAYVEDLNWRWK